MNDLQAVAAIIEDHRDAVGAVHLALHGTAEGLVLSWRQSLEAIAEPSEPCPTLKSLSCVLRSCILDIHRSLAAENLCGK